MSEPNPGGGNRSGGHGSIYEPADESAASVFGEPARGQPPQPEGPQGWPDPRRSGDGRPGYDEPPYNRRGYGAQPPSRAYGPPPTQAFAPTRAYGPPPTQAYAPAPPEAPPGCGHRPAGYDERTRSRGGHTGSDQRRRTAGAGRDEGASSRDGGSGLPIGLGALIGFAGLAAFLASLFVLPWFVDGGRDVTLADIRSAFTVAQTDPDALLPSGPEAPPPDVTEGVPSPDQVGDAVEQQAREAAADVAASAIDSGRSRYLELYTDTLWLVLAGAVTLATVFSTVLSPRSLALSLILGFRRLAGAVTVLAGIVHGAALSVVFTGTGAPSPASGVWIGVGGLVAVLVGCIVGPKT